MLRKLCNIWLEKNCSKKQSNNKDAVAEIGLPLPQLERDYGVLTMSNEV